MKNLCINRLFAAWLGLVISVLFMGCCPTSVNTGGLKDSQDYLQAPEKDMQWWRDAKFGLFVHWGPVSLKGTEVSWSRGGERRCFFREGTGKIPVEEYDNLYKRFNPTSFDADQWVRIAKNAGMKYLVFTTKHHDGFCMFDSKLTDYKITNAPFKRDIVRELADACHKGGIGLGFYYSPADWHHPDFRNGPKRHARYLRYMHGQLDELCSKYGQVDVIWFDDVISPRGVRYKLWDAKNLFKLIRRRQPHVLINNRCGLRADFDTPEEKIGEFQIDRPWESCMTIGTQWSWKPEDSIKSLERCIRMLVRAAGGDGNLLLNVGPTPDGRIEQRQAERLEEIGRWLRKYGESIYNTRGGPFEPCAWGASTYRDNTIYLHFLKWNGQTMLLPPIPQKITAVSVLTGGTAAVKQSGYGIEISLPKEHCNPIDTIIKLQLDEPVSQM